QTVVEDHISALCETMRLLIVGSGDAASQQKQGSTLAPQSVQTQREFFEAHIAPWVEKMCLEIAKQTLANYYAVVGQLTSAFIQVEREGFSI
ncbi:MAG: TorD/DmsD family molecular chaperone, partial [Casimicrobium sp.]